MSEHSPQPDYESAIAIIGVACRFPGAPNPEAFWKNLRDGVESIRFFEEAALRDAGVSQAEMRDPAYVRACGALSDVKMFDAGFFGVSARDASIMDPQHRHFLECAWEALEDAGCDPGRFPGAIGVFAGSGMTAYMTHHLAPNRALMDSAGEFLVRHTGNDKDFLATRVSYDFNLRGPSLNVQTACSTSLVAVHLAIQSLLNGESDMALAGGVTILFPQDRGYLYKEGEILSPDGHCRAFDASSQGTVFGSGAGLVVLRRLADAQRDGDNIRAILLGSAINNDGSEKVGYLAPSVDGQARAIAEALGVAGVEPGTISCVEAHGTGTAVGDPIEVAALTQAFRQGTDRQAYCALGSVKTNIGHLDTAAGIASLIKTVLSLQHRQLPPSLHFSTANPQIDFARSPFYVNSSLRDWETSGVPRRAGISSLGVGGTNAHVIVEEAPEREPSTRSTLPQLLVLSARTATALDGGTSHLAEFLRAHPEVPLGDVAWTLQTGRKGFKHRRMLAVRSVGEAAEALESVERSARVSTRTCDNERASLVFMFPGQGSQYAGMARGLYEDEPLFKTEVDRCAAHLRPVLGLDLREVMFAADGGSEAQDRLKQTCFAQPSLFVVEYALARLLLSWGLKPDAMIGHSVGEYVAACLAGVFSLEDALTLVAIRGRLVQEQPGGAMVVVHLGEAELAPWVGGALSIAAINAPDLCVVSGPYEAIAEFEGRLAARGTECQRLHTSHAFHSAMLDPVVGPLTERVRGIALRPPAIPIASNLTGGWMTGEEATHPEYWARHLRGTVRFSDGLKTVLASPDRVLLEVGPGKTLGMLARRHPMPAVAVIASLRHPQEEKPDSLTVREAVGRLWLSGVEPDWLALAGGRAGRRVSLPTYAWDHQSHWIEAGPQEVSAPQPDSGRKPDVGDWFYIPSWRRTLLPQPQTRERETWLVLEDGVGLGERLAEVLPALSGRPPQGGPAPVPEELVLTSPGEVESFELRPAERVAPAAGQVEIEVRAAALQFKDVLMVLGMYEGKPMPLGIECAGVVTRVGEGVDAFAPGDEVIAIGPGSFRTYVNRDWRHIVRKPAGLSFEEAAAIPSAFLTAAWALEQVGHLQRGERVLIHAAAGGVGLAAVQIAQRAGAEVFGTVGSADKRGHLERLGVRHLYRSRTLDFADEIRRDTRGAGVDVVLNSLAGEFVGKSLGLLHRGGRFLELGRRDLLEEGPDGIGYSVIDMDWLREREPAQLHALFQEVTDRFTRGELRALPMHVYSWHDAAAGFSLMMKARHIGKVVLTLQPPPVRVVRVSAAAAFARCGPDSFSVNPGRTEDFATLLRELDGAPLRRVVHLWNVTAPGSTATGGQVSAGHLARGFQSLLGLAPLLAGRQEEGIALDIVSNHLHRIAGEPCLEPEKALLLGPCRVIPHEFPQVRCRNIDVIWPASRPADGDRTVRQLAAELASGSADEVIAWRGSDRWLQIHEPVRLEAPGTSGARIRSGGVYLITGGLGGLGLYIARHLANQRRVKLVLLGRSPLPPRSEWTNWLTTHPDDDPTGRRLRQIREIESAGSQVFVAAADVTDPARLAAALAEARRQFGPIHGVFHAAGTVDDALIPLKTAESVANVLAPKVQGTLAIEAAVTGDPLDFLIVFSSVSAWLGLAGQSDYAAANAFLDAFAQSRTESNRLPVTAVGWSAWREIGMAAELAAGTRQPGTHPEATPVAHPLLQRRFQGEAGGWTFRARLDARQDWFLAEHRNPQGETLLPGTAYLELVHAALQSSGNEAPVEIGELMFLLPMVVDPTLEIEAEFRPADEGFDFTVRSRRPTGWVEHASGTAQRLAPDAPRSGTLESLKARCSRRHFRIHNGVRAFRQEELMQFGPRWRNIREVWHGATEALALLELAPDYAQDLERFRLHPALVDMATAFGLPLLEGYDGDDAFYAPFGYHHVRILGPLPARIWSHVRCLAGKGSEFATFNVTLMDEEGRVLVEIREFTMKRVPLTALATASAPKAIRGGPESNSQASPAPAVRVAGLDPECSLSPEEGVDVLERILARADLPQVIVSPRDIAAWRKEVDEQARGSSGHDEAVPEGGLSTLSKQPRPDLGNPCVAPRNEIEARLVEMWQDLLGVAPIGVLDNFFDLGGHSLLAVRVVTRTQKLWQRELPLRALFEAPTIEQLAALVAPGGGSVKDQGGAGSGGTSVAAPQAVESDLPPRQGRALLVRIQAKGSRSPVFCVSALGGGVHYYSRLSRHLGPDQPVFALHPLDPRTPAGQAIADGPIETRFERTVTPYIDEMREVQPEGPYFLTGHSLCGLLAFELAVQLERAGHEVGFVALFDAYRPDDSKRLPLPDQIGRHMREFLHAGTRDKMEVVLRGVGRVMDKLNREIKGRRGGGRQAEASAEDLRDAETILREAQRDFAAAQMYQPPPFSGRVILFRCDEVFAGSHSGEDLGWGAHAAQGVEVVKVPGDHGSLLEDPNIGVLAELLKQRLDQSGRRLGSVTPRA